VAAETANRGMLGLVREIAKDNVKDGQGSAARQCTSIDDSMEYGVQRIGVGEISRSCVSVTRAKL
jgi:hypothetical protein